MKKVTPILAIAALAIAFTSCKKDHTCECTTTVAGVTATGTTTINDTKKKAKDACKALETTTSTAGISASTTCELK